MARGSLSFCTLVARVERSWCFPCFCGFPNASCRLVWETGWSLLQQGSSSSVMFFINHLIFCVCLNVFWPSYWLRQANRFSPAPSAPLWSGCFSLAHPLPPNPIPFESSDFARLEPPAVTPKACIPKCVFCFSKDNSRCEHALSSRPAVLFLGKALPRG